MDMAQNLDASSRRKLVPVENGKPLRINDVEKDDKGASKPVSQHPNQYPSIPAKVHPNQYPSIPADASSRRKPVPVENDDGLEVLDKQNTEVHSVKSFDELPLSGQLGRGVYHMGFDEPSKVQERALPILLADPASNVILQSQYGTGKRAAALLSMIYRVDPGWKFPQGIFVSPTKELALHTGRMAEKMVKFCPEITIGYAVRGERVLRGQNVKHQILCGTPGTVLDWMLVFKVLDPTNVKIIVWDEADVMITLQGHQDQSIRIYKNLGNDCQIILLSATRTDEVIKFANTVVPDPIVIQLRQEEESLDNIKQRYVVCRNREVKFQALSNLCCIVSIGLCVVFCRDRRTASRLKEKMISDGVRDKHSVALFSGQLAPHQRIEVLKKFSEGNKERLLITTDASPRISDVKQVTLVVNWDMPVESPGSEFKTYLHRIGRIGRFAKCGVAVSFIDDRPSFNILKKIADHLGKEILLLNTDVVDELEKLC